MKISLSKLFTWLKPVAVVALLAISVTACPRPRGNPALTVTAGQRIYKMPFDRVWDVALAIVTEDLNYPLEIVERSNGMIATEWVKFERKQGDFEESERTTLGMNPRVMLVQYRIMVMVKITPDGTLVRVRRYEEDWLDRWTPKATDLSFERSFLLIMDQRLGAQPGQIL